MTVAVGFNPRLAMTRERFVAEMRGSPTRMKLVADCVEMVQSSLRDEIVWRDDRPWVETHGYVPRSLCDQGQEPMSHPNPRSVSVSTHAIADAIRVEHGLAEAADGVDRGLRENQQPRDRMSHHLKVATPCPRCFRFKSCRAATSIRDDGVCGPRPERRPCRCRPRGSS